MLQYCVHTLSTIDIADIKFVYLFYAIPSHVVATQSRQHSGTPIHTECCTALYTGRTQKVTPPPGDFR